MKAITLWQPWASLLACGAKIYETRSWKTDYRGPIAIHAAQKPAHKIFSKLIEYDTAKLMLECLRPLDIWFPADLPHGCIIATADLVNCWRIVNYPGTNVDMAKNMNIRARLDVSINHPDFNKYIIPTEQEMLFGDWTTGRYAWEVKNVKILPEPISAKGHQRLWNWEEL